MSILIFILIIHIHFFNYHFININIYIDNLHTFFLNAISYLDFS